MSVSSFLILLGQDSMQAGVLVLAVLLARKILGARLTPRWRSGLWLLVMVRLLLLVSFSSVVSVFNLMPHTRAQTSAGVATGLAGQSTGVPDANPSWTARTPFSETPNPQPRPAPRPDGFEAIQPAPAEPITVAAPPLAREGTFWDAWAPVFFRVWLGGVVCLLIWVVAGSIKIHRHLSRIPSASDAKLLELLAECKARMQIRGELRLAESPRIATPALHGFLRPKLLLPPGFAGRFSAQELRFVLLHELAHVKRRDILFNWLATVLQILHWFNPLIWCGFASWRSDRELACDALALEASGENQNRAYGHTILRLLENFSRRSSAPGLVGILEDKRQLRWRIRMIANYVPAKKWPLAALLLVGVLAVVGLTDAQNNAPGSNLNKDKPHAAVNNVAAPAQEIAQQVRRVVTEGPEMKVMVLDAETGQPLSDAEVLAPNDASFGFSGGPENSPHWFTDKQGVAIIHLGRIFRNLGKARLNPMRVETWLTISVRHKNYSPRGLSWSSETNDVRETMPKEISVQLRHGIVAGGVVRDEAGNPVEGVRVRVFGSDHWRAFDHEYSEFWNDSVDSAMIATDASGHWQVADFPADLHSVRIDLTRPGGAMESFVQEGESRLGDPGTPMNLDRLKANKAIFILPKGKTIRGIVVDQSGKPIRGAQQKARPVMVYVPPPYVFTNNRDGTFELRHWNDVQLLVAAEAPEYATKTVTITPAEESSGIRIVLRPAKPLRIRVVGNDGEPVAAAKITVNDWRARDQILDWSGQTDNDGLAVWSNAPDRSVPLNIDASNYPPRSANLLADGTEKTIRLSQESGQRISVHLRALDADSGQPLKTFEVFRDLQSDMAFNNWGPSGKDGEFHEEIKAAEFRAGVEDRFVLQIRAKGYVLWTSEDCHFDGGDVDLVAKMRRAPVRIVLQPDGQPAANATVRLNLSPLPASIYANLPNIFYPSGSELTEHTGEDGSFHLSAAAPDEFIMIRHPSGFLSITVDELTRVHEVRLQPWAAVVGVLQNGIPLAGQRVALQSPLNWTNVVDFMISGFTDTDEEGRFAFTNLPAGYYVLFREPLMATGERQVVESHRLVFDLQPGEHKKLDYSFGGRNVVGHVDTTEPVDWRHDAQVLVAKAPPLPPAPGRWQYADPRDFEKAKLAYDHSPETLAAEQQQQQFQLVFDDDGNFRADDVPPGTYELRLRLSKPPEKGKPRIPWQQQECGSLKREVVVPAGQGAFDLGSFTMAVSPEAAIKVRGGK